MNIVGGTITGQAIEQSKSQFSRLGYDPETRELKLYDGNGGILGTVNVGVSAFDQEQIRQIVKEEIAAIRKDEQRRVLDSIKGITGNTGDITVRTSGCCSNSQIVPT